MTVERRKYIRFVTKKQTFAALRSGFEKAGRVLDISINGLAFTYVLEKSITTKPFQVDIFQSDNGLYISNIPCRVVYDIPVTNQKFDTLIQLRRCGLCFGRLPEKQYSNLVLFLGKATKAAANRRGRSALTEDCRS